MSKPGKNAAKANAGKTNGGNGKSNGHDAKAGPPEPDPVKTYHEGEPFPGRIGRTWDVSEPAFPVPREAPPGAPNILYIVLDDVGFGWADTFGGLVETPNITRLAKGGLSYVNHHTTALCSPTRACLLTGRNHHSVGMANITELASGFPGYNGRQPQDKAAIAAMLHEHGYTSFALGKWHNTPSEETSIAGPYDRWPTGPVFGFDRFYGFFGGDSSQWYPKLYLDREPIDQPRLPEEGYHLSEDITDRAIPFLSNHESVTPDKPWLCYFAFAACHAPHHVAPEWIAKYKGKLDMGWDRYREIVLARQKEMGVVPPQTELPPMLEGVQKWETLSAEEKRLFARMAEVYAGFLSHADHADWPPHRPPRRERQPRQHAHLRLRRGQRLVGRRDAQRGLQRDVFGGGRAGGPEAEPRQHRQARPARVVQPLSDRVGARRQHAVQALQAVYPLRRDAEPSGRALAEGDRAKGELRDQFHHVIDIVPTILAAIGIERPNTINGVQQALLEGVPMNYSFDAADAPTNHPTQYFEMLGNRAIVDGKWKAVTFHGRKPWENRAAWGFDDDRWELYDLEKDPSECHDLMAGRQITDLDDPMAKKLIELVGLWWAEAGRHSVLPLDDRFQERGLAREGLQTRTKFRFLPGAIRVPEHAAPNTMNRSWSADAEVEIPAGGAEGPILVMGGDTNGWSLYLKVGKPTFCYNLGAVQLTYIRAEEVVEPGKHIIRYEFEKRGTEKFGAGGVGRLFVDGDKVAEGEIPRTSAFGYSLDETFDVGCDKGAPVTDEYPALAAFTGKIIKVDIDLKPDLTIDADRHHDEKVKSALLRQ